LQEELESLEGIDPSDFEISIEPLGPRRRLDNAILRATEGFDLIIMGAPDDGLIQRAMFGDVPESVAKQVKIPVILTKRYTGAVKSWFQQLFGSRKTFLE
jgi:nucleotide-binding universal stress UspA family protein